jgi:hypothetical protein
MEKSIIIDFSIIVLNTSFLLFVFQSTLAEPCGYNRKNSIQRRPTYSVLQRQQKVLLQQQQNSQLQRHRNNSDNVQKHLRAPSLPNTQRNSATNQTEQQASQRKWQRSGEDEEHSFALIERRLHDNPAEFPVDTVIPSYLAYVCRPRGSSVSSQTTLTTSLGKLSLNEGNNNCRSGSAIAVGDENAARHGSLTINGHCKQSKLDPVVARDHQTKIYVTSKDMAGKNNIESKKAGTKV